MAIFLLLLSQYQSYPNKQIFSTIDGTALRMKTTLLVSLPCQLSWKTFKCVLAHLNPSLLYSVYIFNEEGNNYQAGTRLKTHH